MGIGNFLLRAADAKCPNCSFQLRVENLVAPQLNNEIRRPQRQHAIKANSPSIFPSRSSGMASFCWLGYAVVFGEGGETQKETMGYNLHLKVGDLLRLCKVQDMKGYMLKNYSKTSWA